MEVDYLVIGAGAAGMAFADTLLSDSEATMVIVDRRDRPGGHWNDAYPFVRLHQPAAYYGVASQPLGSGRRDDFGPNKGFYELASGQEVLTHYDRAMRQRFLPSGRVTFLPLSEVDDEGVVTSLLSGRTTTVSARTVVDAAFSRITIPSTHTRRYEVADGVACIPPNDLPRAAPGRSRFVVVGAGKTGMDAILWLLDNGADPDSIRWVMPRDYWLLNRACFQPGPEFLERTTRSLADQVDAAAHAESVDDLFTRLEGFGEVRRLDPAIKPEGYHGAIVSDGEVEQLRRVRDIVRLGRVNRIDADGMVLEGGSVSTEPDAIYIDCTATGIPTGDSRPVFEDGRITLQFVRVTQPVFSAAFIAHVEAVVEDPEEKNLLCTPLPAPDVPFDWVRMMKVELSNRYRWSKDPRVDDWVAATRLDFISGQIRSLTGNETEVMAHLQRYAQNAAAAVANAERLLAGG
ncbi:MAG TPA: NAD(P)-binding protein [Acidimicrobiales bacterium]|nr:NAD(P)-binding protein [Acidimicrobiales bacterium]